uniref:hypothetical protein n=1 Tax=Ornithobacterium rhinotracheale TaxID=28251 RepID=UPI001C8851B8|nr:hypothetical protein [Ornithobacterium rhinotracheale]
MKKIYIMLLINSFFVHTLSSQTLIQQIENAYNTLDSASYIENVLLSYKKHLLKSSREAEDFSLELLGVYNNMDSIQRKKTLDSVMGKYGTIVLSYREELTKKKVWERLFNASGRAIARANLGVEDSIQKRNIIDSISREFSKISMERNYSVFFSAIKNKPMHYVLNLQIDSCGQSLCLLPDTSELSFNLFDFGKNFKGSLFVYVDEGRYSFFDTRYLTYSRKLGVNAPKVFRKIMHKQPKYLLYCSALEGMNTILYVLNDKIYVYRIVQMEEYELSDYIKKFDLIKNANRKKLEIKSNF